MVWNWRTERKLTRHSRKANREINAGLADPGTKATLAESGAAPMVQTPSQFLQNELQPTEPSPYVVYNSSRNRQGAAPSGLEVDYHRLILAKTHP
jgi:hypothetical protein